MRGKGKREWGEEEPASLRSWGGKTSSYQMSYAVCKRWSPQQAKLNTNSSMLAMTGALTRKSKVAAAGGRIYLAKDSRKKSHVFRRTYKNASSHKNAKNHEIFASDLSLRLGI